MTIFSSIQPSSLKQRITLFVLIPVFLLLFSMGAVGFFYTRDILLDQWEETALLKLEQAAHNNKVLASLIEHQSYMNIPAVDA